MALVCTHRNQIKGRVLPCAAGTDSEWISGENGKIVQKFLRHANSKITLLDVYQRTDQGAKRLALDRRSKIFVVPPVKSA